ncbi:MAG TPA: response regulator [Burkholderiales bacterium]|nr:response regulator [Burkholderiales bacterium]
MSPSDPVDASPVEARAGAGRILVVDDQRTNVELMAGLLRGRHYDVCTAFDGEQALRLVHEARPDLVVSDIMMPVLDGYELCRRLRSDPQTALLPVVLVTSLDPQAERVRGIEAGADDFLSKPVNWTELFARVRSLLRVKSLQDEVLRQAEALRDWNAKLEERVTEQVGAIQRLGRLKRFFSPQVADAIVAGGEDMLAPHRRDITAVFLDLRGFTAFTDRADPEEVLELLRSYHATLGTIVSSYGGTLEHFAGDGVMIFFNDPFPVDRPAERAVRMAAGLQQAFVPIAEAWARLGHEVGLGIGIAQGEATLGVIGFEQRWEYAAIGNVPNLAARLCGEARAGEIILDAQTEAALVGLADSEHVGPLRLRGFQQPVPAFRLQGLRTSG